MLHFKYLPRVQYLVATALPVPFQNTLSIVSIYLSIKRVYSPTCDKTNGSIIVPTIVIMVRILMPIKGL